MPIRPLRCCRHASPRLRLDVSRRPLPRSSIALATLRAAELGYCAAFRSTASGGPCRAPHRRCDAVRFGPFPRRYCPVHRIATTGLYCANAPPRIASPLRATVAHCIAAALPRTALPPRCLAALGIAVATPVIRHVMARCEPVPSIGGTAHGRGAVARSCRSRCRRHSLVTTNGWSYRYDRTSGRSPPRGRPGNGPCPLPAAPCAHRPGSTPDAGVRPRAPGTAGP